MESCVSLSLTIEDVLMKKEMKKYKKRTRPFTKANLKILSKASDRLFNRIMKSKIGSPEHTSLAKHINCVWNKEISIKKILKMVPLKKCYYGTKWSYCRPNCDNYSCKTHPSKLTRSLLAHYL